MKLTRLCAVAAVGALLALPALAQTTTTSPSTTNRAAPPAAPPAAPMPQSKPVPPATSGSTAPSAGTGTGASTSKSKVIDINSASRDELMTLPGIGEARSDAIVKNRPYRSKDELVSKNIVPSNVYSGIKNQIAAVGGSKNTASATHSKKP